MDGGELRINKYERTRLQHVLEWENQFWKIGRPSYGVNITMSCRDCQEVNYQLGPKRYEIVNHGKHGKEYCRFFTMLCDKCTLMNIDNCNLQMNHASEYYPDIFIKENGSKKRKHSDD